MEEIKQQIANENPHLSPEPPLAVITCENTKPHPRLQWTKVSVPFAKGAMPNEARLNEYGVLGGFYEWRVLKWHFEEGQKHSIAIAQLKFVAYHTGPGSLAVPILKTAKAKLLFSLHSNIQSYINELFGSVIAKVKLSGDEKEYVAFPLNTENLKIVSATDTGITYRSRTMVKTQTLTGTITGKLSCTAFVEVNYQDPMIKMQVVFGNDVLEAPQAGGVGVESIRFESSQRVILSTLMPSAYAISFMGDHFVDAVTPATHFPLGDGQTVAFRINAFVKPSNEPASQDDWLYRTFLAECQEPLMPLLDYSVYKEAGALNLYQGMAPVRFRDKAQAKATSETFRGAPLVGAKATSFLGGLNQNPGATGAQPDFAATVSAPITEALQVGSQKLLFKMLMQVDRECMRPSYYWETKNGTTDRVKMQDYPNLFFWSSRPHFDFSWNNTYPAWYSRTNNAGFNQGDFSGWWGHDNQHLSNNNLRTMYELTGDPYLQDLCEYYITVIYWNFFTRWVGNTEAERTHRTMKDALSHALLFFDTPNAQTLIEKIKFKMNNTFKTECENIIATFPAHCAAVAPFNSCDPRVMGGQYCVTNGNPHIVAACWQTGFHMEFLNLMIQLGFDKEQATAQAQLYQNAIDMYYLEDGTPNANFLLTDPSIKTQGGYGVWWWAGWAQLAKHFPGNPKIENLKQQIAASLGIHGNQVVSDNDGWNSF